MDEKFYPKANQGWNIFYLIDIKILKQPETELNYNSWLLARAGKIVPRSINNWRSRQTHPDSGLQNSTELAQKENKAQYRQRPQIFINYCIYYSETIPINMCIYIIYINLEKLVSTTLFWCQVWSPQSFSSYTLGALDLLISNFVALIKYTNPSIYNLPFNQNLSVFISL